jgi:sarcosine oxidase gamma subunit
MLRSDTRVRISISGHQAPTVMQRLVDLGIRPARLEIGQPLPDIGVKIDKL